MPCSVKIFFGMACVDPEFFMMPSWMGKQIFRLECERIVDRLRQLKPRSLHGECQDIHRSPGVRKGVAGIEEAAGDKEADIFGRRNDECMIAWSRPKNSTAISFL